MTRRKARRIAGLLLLWVIALAVILFVLPHEARRGYLLGYAIACALAIVAISQVHQHVLPQLRRMPLYVAVGVTALLYMGAIVLSSAIGIVVLAIFATGSLTEAKRDLVRYFAEGSGGKYAGERWIITLVVPFLIALGILFLVELSRRIGPGRLLSLLLGKYRNPREETRILLFLDLTGSTSLAESLGAVKYSTFLRDFFDDLTEPVLETGGEIVEYVGDEAIVSWRLRPGRYNEAFRCYLLFRKRIEERADEYMKVHGVVPKFKAALHAGPVVATEVGQVRTQVVLHGDALNTTARVLAECGPREADLLMTDSIAPHLAPVDGFLVVDLGRVALRGKWEPLGLAKLMPCSQVETETLPEPAVIQQTTV